MGQDPVDKRTTEKWDQICPISLPHTKDVSVFLDCGF